MTSFCSDIHVHDINETNYKHWKKINQCKMILITQMSCKHKVYYADTWSLKHLLCTITSVKLCTYGYFLPSLHLHLTFLFTPFFFSSVVSLSFWCQCAIRSSDCKQISLRRFTAASVVETNTPPQFILWKDRIFRQQLNCRETKSELKLRQNGLSVKSLFS